MTRQGLRLIAVAAVLFVLGFWFFESAFSTGRMPMDLAAGWPLALIGVGLVLVVINLLGISGSRRAGSGGPADFDVRGTD